jgi:hypothetical protein
MASPSAGGIAELSHRVEELETRVRKLENHLSDQVSPVWPIGAKPVPELASGLELQDAGRLVPLLGKALLALAGAYLLRALTTSSFAPAWAGIALGLGYAVLWMLWATRLGASNALASSVYMTTAVLALSPMLWETTVRFHVMSSGVAAMALASFVILSLILSWKRQIPAVVWLAASAGAMMALALSVGTYDLLPFCGGLLAVAATFEAAAFQDLWLGPRRLVGFAADLAMLWFVYIHSSGPNLPEAYRPVPEGLQWATPGALFLIYAAGTTARTLNRKLDVTVFEIFQVLFSLTLFIYAASRGAESHLLLGIVLVTSGALCYWVSFVRPIRGLQPRNLYVYSAFGLGLTLLGTAICLPRSGSSIVWAFAAAGLAALATRVGGLAVTSHVLAFLAAAGLGSGLAKDTFSVLLRDGAHVALTSAVLFEVAAIIGAYVFLRRIVPRAIVATMLAWVIAAWAASLLLSGLPGSTDVAWRAEIRTVLLIVTAVAIAVIGRHWQRAELYWLVPGAMVIALYRLLAEDFRVGRPETLSLSLLFYGGALLLLSGFMRRWRHE